MNKWVGVPIKENAHRDAALQAIGLGWVQELPDGRLFYQPTTMSFFFIQLIPGYEGQYEVRDKTSFPVTQGTFAWCMNFIDRKVYPEQFIR